MTRMAISVSAIALLSIGALTGCNNASAPSPASPTTASAPSTTTPTTSTTATTAASYTGHELAGEAQVTLDRARETALAARAGTITDQELEREGGGSGLRYSFDIRSNNVTYEIGVDAKTGAVLENAAEGPNPD